MAIHIVVSMILTAHISWSAASTVVSQPEMAMPTFEDSSGHMKTAHITSEIVLSAAYLASLDADDDDNYHHNSDKLFLNEFAFLDNGEQYFTLSSMSHGTTSYYLDGLHEGRIYRYRPYYCASSLLSLANFYPHLWHERGFYREFDHSQFSMRWFGVSALWLMARHGQYTHEIVYVSETIDQTFVRSHKWTYDDLMDDFRVSFYFEISDTEALPLRHIIMESKRSRQITITINVLDVEKAFDAKVFELPLGYGCERQTGLNDLDDLPHGAGQSADKEASFVLDMEITASTKQSSSGHPTATRTSAITFRLARAGETVRSAGEMNHQLQMTVMGGVDSDRRPRTKIVWDQATGVRYTVDYGTDQCQQASFESLLNEPPIRLEFENGLWLDLTRELWNQLFVATNDFYLVWQTHHLWDQNQNQNQPNRLLRKVYYMERQFSDASGEWTQNEPIEHPSSLVQVSIVRRYNVPIDSDRRHSESQADNEAPNYLDRLLNGLDEVWLVVYNEARTQQLAKYVFRLDYTKLTNYETLIRLFDVTPCYNVGAYRQMALVRFIYPMSERLIGLLESQVDDIRHYFLANILQHNHHHLSATISPLQIPKVEAQFNRRDGHMTVSALLLDGPSPLVRFKRHPNKMLVLSDGANDSGPNTDQDGSKQLAEDELHCSRLCQLIRCKLFSFCNGSHTCLMVHSHQQGARIVDAPMSNTSANQTKLYGTCTLWALQGDDTDGGDAGGPNNMSSSSSTWKRAGQSLHYIIAQLQHDSYDEDYALALGDLTNYDSDFAQFYQMSKATKGYFGKVDQRHPLAAFTLPVEVRRPMRSLVFMRLVPIRFELDTDPLEELMDNDHQLSTGLANEIDPRHIDFQLGVTGVKYKQPLEGLIKVAATKTYNECSLYCVDAGPNCDSFSYCHLTNECIVSVRGLQARGQATSSAALPTIQEAGCVIARRHYLAKFTKTSSTYVPDFETRSRSQLANAVTDVSSESECANECIMMTDKCRSFDYCRLGPNLNKTICYLEFGRLAHLSTTSLVDNITDWGADYHDQLDQLDDARGGSHEPKTECVHYERSYLADFHLLQHRAYVNCAPHTIDYVSGAIVDECAKRCHHDPDCQSFQFCFTATRRPRQSCTMSNVTIDSTKTTQLTQLVPSDNCHLYLLRQGPNDASSTLYRSTNRPKSARDSMTLSTGRIWSIMFYLLAYTLSILIGVLVVLVKRQQQVSDLSWMQLIKLRR